MSQQTDLRKVSLDLLKNISENFEKLNENLSTLIELKNPKKPHLPPNSYFNVELLLSLPDHLRKTFVTLRNLRRATAKDVAKRTCRARAVESSYLNHLVVMKHVNKERTGRKVYFYV
jgi:hypothetical protein